MDTIIHIELGFKIDDIFFGWHDGKLYQLPYINNGRYYPLRLMKVKTTKVGWNYYRVRRKKMGVERLRAILQSVSWDVKQPAQI